jgi:hypothetical protein
MKRVCVVCEGQTEETFVRDVLAPALVPLNLILIGETIETSSGHKGGALSYERVRRHLRNTLRQKSQPVVTTLFDLYRLDSKFPGFEESKRQGSLANKLSILTGALQGDIVEYAGCRPECFIPYIQPHEFEALLFSDVDTLVGIETGWNRANDNLNTVRASAESPEHINDRPETKPAEHLKRELRNPGYRKTRHGPIAAARIGLARMEAECHFFAAWLATLRKLAANPCP